MKIWLSYKINYDKISPVNYKFLTKIKLIVENFLLEKFNNPF